jgi:cytochrome oxidase Cu insertion factor (SCO1/SenC/PrrC family)
MKRPAFAIFLMLLASVLSVFGQTPQKKGTDVGPVTKFKVGDVAPDFTLRDQNGDPVKLSSFRGKQNVALAFYIFAFTGG